MNFPFTSQIPAYATPALLLAGFLSVSGVHAQSANNFVAPPVTTPPAAVEKPAPEKKKTAQPTRESIGALPSRFIGTDLEAYVQTVSAGFAMVSRATDPFGQYQDPDAKPIAKPTITKTNQRIPTIQTTPFPEIISKIQVNTVMPKDKMFLIKNRSISQGDTITISFRGKQIPVQVTEVGSRQITFLHSETKETAVLKIQMMPAGMTPGNRGIMAPGMEAENPNAPLELDSAPDLSQGM